MTLHWWMHWFWVTVLLLAHASGGTVGAPTEQPQSDSVTGVGIERAGRARALYYTKTTPPPLHNDTTDGDTEPPPLEPSPPPSSSPAPTGLRSPPAGTADGAESVPAAAGTPVAEAAAEAASGDNGSAPYNASLALRRNNLTRPEEQRIDSRTERPLPQETGRRPPAPEPARRPPAPAPAAGGVAAGAAAGATLAALAAAGAGGAAAVLLWRRRYLNPPLALTDKCSNPDSTGYLDDTTVREPSEEMYSLDNDSFLNSLEAMAIHSYWTDVRHTKL